MNANTPSNDNVTLAFYKNEFDKMINKNFELLSRIEKQQTELHNETTKLWKLKIIIKDMCLREANLKILLGNTYTNKTQTITRAQKKALIKETKKNNKITKVDMSTQTY